MVDFKIASIDFVYNNILVVLCCFDLECAGFESLDSTRWEAYSLGKVSVGDGIVWKKTIVEEG